MSRANVILVGMVLVVLAGAGVSYCSVAESDILVDSDVTGRIIATGKTENKTMEHL